MSLISKNWLNYTVLIFRDKNHMTLASATANQSSNGKGDY